MSANLCEKVAWPSREKARNAASILCVDSLAWAKTIAISVRRSGPELEDGLVGEIIAFGISLAEMQLAELPAPERNSFVGLLKQECAVLLERRKRRQRKRYPRLPAPSASGDEVQNEAKGLLKAAQRGGKQVTKEMFDQFCSSTGLSSNVLVGKGENLASLIFYIVLHAVVSAGGRLTREEVLKLLRAGKGCRAHLEGQVKKWW